MKILLFVFLISLQFVDFNRISTVRVSADYQWAETTTTVFMLVN